MTDPHDGPLDDAGAAAAADAIAIVGMVGRFPGANDLDAFWRNLRGGVESITRFSDEDLAASGIDRALREDPAYVPARGVLADAECFDAPFFGVHPKEAQATDPQQRVFLEAAWAALESAGTTPRASPARSACTRA
jgi:acyl transferase domain-containing protein